jgi:hypothetical protein
MKDCVRHLLSLPNVELHVGELAYGQRDFEITGPNGIGELPDHFLGRYHEVQFRTDHALFHKENIVEAVISRSFPQDWQYGCYCDGDFHFSRYDWALETIHQLQHHPWVQPYSGYADLSGKTLGTAMRPLRINATFAYNWVQGGYQLPEGWTDGGWKKPTSKVIEDHYGGVFRVVTGGEPERKKINKYVGATGGAWAFTKAGYNTTGGLLTTCILGHADWHQTFALVAEAAPDVGTSKYSQGYRHSIAQWQRNALKIKQNIGYTDGFATHGFHGSKYKRFYGKRYEILIQHGFDPYTDLRRDWQGIWQLTDEKPGLRDAIRSYFLERTEDDPTIIEAGGERPLI